LKVTRDETLIKYKNTNLL